MSYSNDWSISGISGLTNLKDCYQEEGVSILRKVGCPRLLDGTPERLNPNDVFRNTWRTPRAGDGDYLKFYNIPNYSINNKNIVAYGSLTHAIDEGYGFQFNKPLSYFGAWSASWTSSNAKRWNYIYYPLVLADNLTDYRPDGVTHLARNDAQNAWIISSYDSFNSSDLRVKYIPNSILKSLYRIEENPLHINKIDIDIDTVAYGPHYDYALSQQATYNQAKLLYFNQNTHHCSYKDASDSNNNNFVNGDLIRYNYILYMTSPISNFNYLKIYGETIPTTNLNQLLFKDTQKEVYGFGQYDCEVEHLTNDSNAWNYYYNGGEVCNFNSSILYQNVRECPFYKEIVPAANYSVTWRYYNHYINFYPKDSVYSRIYQHNTGSNDHTCGGYVLCSSIFAIVPQYRWFDSNNSNLYSSGYFSNTGFFIDWDYEYDPGDADTKPSWMADGDKKNCYQITKWINMNHSNHQTSQNNYAAHALHHTIKYNTSYRIDASNNTHYYYSGTHDNFIVFVDNFYNGTVSIPFPYDNTNYQGVLSIYAPNSVNMNQQNLENPKSSQILKWQGGSPNGIRYAPDMAFGLRDGIIEIDQTGYSGRKKFPAIRHQTPHGTSYTTLALDFSLELATKNDSVPPRRAIVGFVTEPIWLELTSDHHNYELKHKYGASAPIIDQYPLSMEVTFYFVDGEQTVNLTFENNVWSWENGPHKITTYNKIVSYFYENSRKDFESTWVSLIHSVARYTNDRYTKVDSTSSNYDPKGFGENTSYYQLTDIISVGDKLLLEWGNWDIEIEVGQSRFSSYVYAAGGGYWKYFVYDSQSNRLFSWEDVDTSEYEYQEYEFFDITSMTLYKYFEKVEENVSNYNPEGYTDEESQPIYAGYYQLNSGVITGITPYAQIAVPVFGDMLNISVSSSSAISRSSSFQPDRWNTYQACYDPINYRVYITHYYEDSGEDSGYSYYTPNNFVITIH